jgi:hypothetical protein
MTRIVPLVAALAAMLISAPAASPATPFSAGAGHDPQVAVGPSGTGHVVWMTGGPAGDRVGYCRVPQGGAACQRSELFAFPGTSAANGGQVAQVFAPDADRVIVLGSCWNCGAGGITDRIFLWSSTDGGATFSSAVEAGRGMLLGGQAAFVNLNLWVGIGGGELVGMGSSPIPTAPVQFTTSPIIATPAVVRVPGTDQLVAVAGDLDDVRFSLYEGPLNHTAVNVPSSWDRDQPVAGATGGATETSLAAGPAGTFLAYRRGPVGDDGALLQGWDPVGRTFGPAREIQGDHPLDNDVSEPDLTQDPAGRLHVAWRSNLRDGRLRYRRSTDGGATFSPAANLAVHEPFGRPELAAAADGTGFAVWQGASGATRVVSLDPQPEPADPDPPRTDPPPAVPTPPGTSPPTIRVPAELEVMRLVLDRRSRTLRLSGRISREAGGTVRLRLRTPRGRRTFAPAIDGGRISLRARVPRAMARAGTGAVTIAYAGDSRTTAETVRLRAGRRAARLRPRRTTIGSGRLRAAGTVTRRARGRVTVRLRFLADGAYRSHSLRVSIRRGRYRVDEALPTALRGLLARRVGAVRLTTTYAGQASRRIHGEQRISSVAVSG